MLIILEDTIIEDIKNNKNNNDFLALNNIAESIKNKRHIVIGSRKLMRYLSSLNQLGDVSRNIYMNLSMELTEIGEIKNIVDSYVVVKGGGDPVRLFQQNNFKIYYVPLSYFSNSEHIAPTRLVTEDLKDYSFYLKLTKRYMKEKEIQYNLSIRAINGGGLNTGINYEHEVCTSHSPCIVIIDSDKKSRDSEYGKTAKPVNIKYEQLKSKYITDCHIINVREKENLVIPSLYALCNVDKNMRSKIDLLDCVYNNPHLGGIYVFSDIKSGIPMNEIIEIQQNKNAVKDYLKDEINKLLEKESVNKALLENVGDTLSKIYPENNLSKVIKNIDTEMIKEVDVNNSIEQIFTHYDHKKMKNIKFVEGIGRTIDTFEKEILDNGIEDILKEKQSEYNLHKTTTLREEVSNLEKNYMECKEIINKLPEALKDEWSKIAIKILTWGCSSRLGHVS